MPIIRPFFKNFYNVLKQFSFLPTYNMNNQALHIIYWFTKVKLYRYKNSIN